MDKKVCGFVIPDGSVPVCAQTKRGGEKKAISLQTPASISEWHQTEEKGIQGLEEIRDEPRSSLQDGNRNGCL